MKYEITQPIDINSLIDSIMWFHFPFYAGHLFYVIQME